LCFALKLCVKEKGKLYRAEGREGVYMRENATFVPNKRKVKRGIELFS